MKYRVVIEPDGDGVFVAECPALPGCISQGKTRAEALANIKDAMTGYLASLKKHDESVPPPISRTEESAAGRIHAVVQGIPRVGKERACFR
jgi:predicted RNase H-like HicB family nuclease